MSIANVNGIQMHYDVRGSGAPLVFVHGLGSTAHDWEAQVPAFIGDRQVITMDLRGHGRSQRPSGPYSTAMLANDIADLLLTLKTGPVDLVGLSLGGMVSLQLTADHPSLVRRLVVVNSGPDLRPQRLTERINLWQRRLLIRTIGLKPFGRILAKRLLPDDSHAALRADFEQRFADNSVAPYLSALNAVMSTDLTARLTDIRCPVLVISADQDYWPISRKEAYVAKLSDARHIVVENSRHALPVERPEAFNAVLRIFLTERS